MQRREVTLTNHFGTALTAHFQVVTDDGSFENDTYNYYENPNDFMLLAAHARDWIIEGRLP